MADSKIVVFQDKQIRRAWMNEQWYFSIADVVEFLTDSVDVKQYIKRMRQRDPLLNRNWGTICTPVAMIAADGRRRSVQAADVKGLFRIIQSIPSPKAEPFKQWLAQVGYERVQEIENPEPGAGTHEGRLRGQRLSEGLDRQTAAGHRHTAEPDG